MCIFRWFSPTPLLLSFLLTLWYYHTTLSSSSSFIFILCPPSPTPAWYFKRSSGNLPRLLSSSRLFVASTASTAFIRVVRGLCLLVWTAFWPLHPARPLCFSSASSATGAYIVKFRWATIKESTGLHRKNIQVNDRKIFRDCWAFLHLNIEEPEAILLWIIEFYLLIVSLTSRSPNWEQVSSSTLPEGWFKDRNHHYESTSTEQGGYQCELHRLRRLGI